MPTNYRQEFPRAVGFRHIFITARCQVCKPFYIFDSRVKAWIFANPCAQLPLVVTSKIRARHMPVDRADDNQFGEPDDIDEAALAAVLRIVPLGAAVLAGSAVALVVLGYLAIYLLVFLPRGVVG
jgi:hypothetical protein